MCSDLMRLVAFFLLFVLFFDEMQELPSLSYASRLSLAALEDELMQTTSSMQLLREELNFCLRENDSGFARLFKEKEMTIAVNEMKQRLTDCRKQFEDTVLFFGEDPTTMDAFEFFSIFVSFRQLIVKAQKAKAQADKKKITTKKATNENKVNL
jgi:hypothetical protein